MTKRKSKFKVAVAAAAVALLASMCTIALGGCVQETQVTVSLEPQLEAGATLTDGTLTVGVNASNSPYAGTNSSNAIVGLDVDIASALAEDLGCKVSIVDIGSSGKTALTDKKVDLVMGMTKSGTVKSVTYSDPYLEDGTALYCLSAEAPASVKDVELSKEKVIVQGDTNAALEVQEAIGIENTLASSTMQDAFDSLRKGTAKYLVADSVIGDYFARNYSDVTRVSYLSAADVTPVYAVTLTENTELTTKADEAMKSLISDGTLRVIVSKWLGSDGSNLLPGVTDPTTLPATLKG